MLGALNLSSRRASASWSTWRASFWWISSENGRKTRHFLIYVFFQIWKLERLKIRHACRTWHHFCSHLPHDFFPDSQQFARAICCVMNSVPRSKSENETKVRSWVDEISCDVGSHVWFFWVILTTEMDVGSHRWPVGLQFFRGLWFRHWRCEPSASMSKGWRLDMLNHPGVERIWNWSSPYFHASQKKHKMNPPKIEVSCSIDFPGWFLHLATLAWVKPSKSD